MLNPAKSYNDGNILISILIDICNRYSISSKHFFIRNSQLVSIKELVYYQSKPFYPVVFPPESIKNTFGKESLTGNTLSEVLEILGYSQKRITKWRDEDNSSMRVNDMVELCNALDVSPFCFISDQNNVNAYNMTQAEFFLEENRMLRLKIIELNEIIKKLKKKAK